MAESKSFNMRNPAVKRILQEVKEMTKEPSTDFMSMPLESDIFEWQFAVHGPKDSEFEGGIYHGRITLPPEYPFKPPSFMLLTPSGRFEVQTKICLSISNHHPEHWQPSWSVRTALVALIAFMPTKGNGAIGSLDYTKKERRSLAIKSRANLPKFGSPERQKIIEQIHEAMLKTAPPVPTTPLSEDDSAPPSTSTPEANTEGPNKTPPAPQHPQHPTAPDNSGALRAAPSVPQATSAPGKEQATSAAGPSAPDLQGGAMQAAPVQATLAPVCERGSLSQGTVTTGGSSASGLQHRPAAAGVQAAGPAASVQRERVERVEGAGVMRRDGESVQERALSTIAAVLVLAILFILGQKIVRAYAGFALTGRESEL